MDIKEMNMEGNSENVDFEMKHWWIQTRFNYVDEALKHTKGPFNIVEYGCGTGQNLRYLRTLSKHQDSLTKVTGVDTALPENYSPDWKQANDYLGRTNPSSSSEYNVLIAMDVIEHIEDDEAALREWIKDLASGATILITVPALMSLWSYHDKFMGHYRRYTRKSLEEVCEKVGLKKVKTTYGFSFAYPIVYLVRKLSKVTEDKESDLKPANYLVNFVFKSLGYIEYLLGGCPFIGTSVIGIFKK
jgi:SAM-dependent methyltransferase